MLIYKRSGELSQLLQTKSYTSNTIGLVPTMGALHNGHLSLLKRCKSECDSAVVSIFVNPTQFNNKADFEHYPVTLENDIYILEKNGCDVLFLPDVHDMYPNGSYENEHFDIGFLDTTLEGSYRPGHFQGVCQAVKRLVQIINPHSMYAGQKDYQQCLVIKKLLNLMQSTVKMVTCETVREPDGLAMSSRNMRLTTEERKKAPALYHALHIIHSGIDHDNPEEIKRRARSVLESSDFEVDYIEIAHAQTLQPIQKWNSSHETVALIAASINNVRLIDNLILNE